MQIKQLVAVGKGLAIAILILGVIHDIATFTPLIQEGLSCLNSENLKAMIYMSLVCGTSFILSGAILFNLLKKVEQHSFLSSAILMIGIFLGISGVLSVVYMFDNPFAWMALLLNSGMFFIAIILENKKGSNSFASK